MRLLLDTHALLWMLEGNPRLSARALELLADPAVDKIVSAVSAYEVCLKYNLGKLPAAAPLARAFEQEIMALDLQVLPVTLRHAEAAGKLDPAHRDPFDRLLAGQALVEEVALLSKDAAFDSFGVDRLW